MESSGQPGALESKHRERVSRLGADTRQPVSHEGRCGLWVLTRGRSDGHPHAGVPGRQVVVVVVVGGTVGTVPHPGVPGRHDVVVVVVVGGAVVGGAVVGAVPGVAPGPVVAVGGAVVGAEPQAVPGRQLVGAVAMGTVVGAEPQPLTPGVHGLGDLAQPAALHVGLVVVVGQVVPAVQPVVVEPCGEAVVVVEPTTGALFGLCAAGVLVGVGAW